MKTNTIILLALITIIVIAGAVFFITQQPATTDIAVPNETTPADGEPMPVEPDGGIGDGAEPLPEGSEDTPEPTPTTGEQVIGTSADGNPITVHQFGSGATEVLFVGGIHGGYSYNTTALAYELISYLESNPDAVPASVRVSVIPAMNPDGLITTVGTAGRFDPDNVTATEAEKVAGRFNGNNVDLNRNFACEWAAEGTWRTQTVSGGSAPFSEPEAAAVRDFVTRLQPDAAVVWFSAEGAVYPSACGGDPTAASVALANTYGSAAGYTVDDEFDAYAITGDMVNWMADNRIPAISVLLTDHENAEWSKNQAAITAVLNAYAR